MKKKEPETIWNYIKARQFFPRFAPGIIDWQHKKNGKNGRGNPIKFSAEDIKLIEAGIKQMIKEKIQ